MKRSRFVPRGTLWGVALLAPNLAQGSTWNVDPSGLGDGSYIGDVIALAESGDTIEVAAGTYLEPVNFEGKDLKIVSIDGAESTVISAPAGASVIVENGESVAATLDGFTILDSDLGLSVYESSISVLNCVFRGTGQTDAQGAGVRAYASTVLLENVVFEDNISAYGAIFADNEAHLFGTNVSFSANEGIFGADVYVNNAVVDFDTFESIDSFAAYGGSLHVLDSSLTIDNLTISDTYATYSGGALYAEGSTIEITNSVWTGARNDSGAGSTVSLQGGSATFSDCSISESISTGSGYGAVYLSEGELHMSECSFEANQNNGGGGGHVTVSNSTLSFTNGELISGGAEAGGAIASESSAVSISGVSFTANSAESVGGAIYSADSDLTLEACDFEANTGSHGGAIALEASAVSLTDSQFVRNRASDDGGAITAIAADTLSLDGVHFENNEATDKGGAVHATDSDGITLKDSRFTGNIAGDQGGAIWSYGTSAVIVLRTLFWGNSAVDGAGAVYQNEGASDWTNTLFQDNETTEGGGGALTLNAVEFTMNNSNVLANASSCCGAIYAYDSIVELANSIVAWNNVGGAYTTDDDTAEQQAHRYNTWFQNSVYHWGGAFEDRNGEEGNAVQDPSLRNFSDDGDSTNDQLSLQDGSPCIDAGLPGHTDWDGSPIDIGLYGGADAGLFDIDQDGVTVEAGDCEDQDDTTLPGATERCDGVDNDCDGSIDEGCSNDTGDTGDTGAQQSGDDTGTSPNGNGGGPPGKVVLRGGCGCSSTGNAGNGAIYSILFVALLSIRRRSFTTIQEYA